MITQQKIITFLNIIKGYITKTTKRIKVWFGMNLNDQKLVQASLYIAEIMIRDDYKVLIVKQKRARSGLVIFKFISNNDTSLIIYLTKKFIKLKRILKTSTKEILKEFKYIKKFESNVLLIKINKIDHEIQKNEEKLKKTRDTINRIKEIRRRQKQILKELAGSIHYLVSHCKKEQRKKYIERLINEFPILNNKNQWQVIKLFKHDILNDGIMYSVESIGFDIKKIVFEYTDQFPNKDYHNEIFCLHLYTNKLCIK